MKTQSWIRVSIALGMAACGQPPVTADEPAQVSRAPLGAPTGGAGTTTAGTVTLITGDRVTVTRAGDAPLVHVEPGPGRTKVAFAVHIDHDAIQVVPSDVAPLVGTDQLDRALFDVGALLAEGYGDDRRADLPLILTGVTPAPSGLARSATPGLVVDREIPAVHAVAARQLKASPGAALAQLGSGAPASGGAASRTAKAAAPAPKIWLDRRYQLVLDRSVPQIGGPAAWARGFTGTGVTIAVLDSGVDASHPDLAGRVAEQREFVGDGLGTSDLVGHGTHVASTIAGSGAASGGRYRGVAPDATLISGRVCDVRGCPGSALLAGMAWAATEQHAPIVNLSIGGPDFPGIDPIEAAVNQLSAQYGTLFVIAAGNRGRGGASTIESPGSADAALTVGAIDRDGARAVFSSRGPRIDDEALKPDITAPGVGIVAARASVVPPDPADPNSPSYLAQSGTSMATPHVAGAAALVHQQHPAWSGAQLKAALMAAAAPSPALTALDQGAGLVDLDRATRQSVTVEPPSVSLGFIEAPFTEASVQTRTITYHNDGDAPIELALAGTLARAGQPSPPGLVVVSPATLAIAAGGAATATVTIDHRVDTSQGQYAGAVIATAGDLRVVTPIAVDRRPQRFNLTLRVLDATGAPGSASVGILELPDGSSDGVFVDGETTIRVPGGTYALSATMDDGESFAMFEYPHLELAADTTVVFDRRVAQPIAVDIPGPPLANLGIAVTALYIPSRVADVILTFGDFPVATAHLGPDAPGEIASWITMTLEPAPVHPEPDAVYELAHGGDNGHFVTGWTETIPRDQLAAVHVQHAGRDGVDYAKGSIAYREDPVGLLQPRTSSAFIYTGSFEHTEYFFGPGFRWVSQLDVGPFGILPDLTLRTIPVPRPAGESVERWNQAPYGPAFAPVEVRSQTFRDAAVARSSAAREGDQLWLLPSLLSDALDVHGAAATQPRNSLSIFATARSALFRDGALVDELFDQDAQLHAPFEVPPEPATYRLEAEIEHPTESLDLSLDLSTRVSAAWTFRSQHAAGAEPEILPLPVVRFTPALDDHNVTGRVHLLPAFVERPAGAATPRITHIAVSASFDDGATWAPLAAITLGDRWLGLVIAPRSATHISLRATARDVQGRQVEQTIVRAYGLTVRPAAP